MNPIHALWTFPAIILAALLIAWAAECGQFYVSQGLRSRSWPGPDFAGVRSRSVIALTAAKDPSKLHLVTANLQDRCGFL